MNGWKTEKEALKYLSKIGNGIRSNAFDILFKAKNGTIYLIGVNKSLKSSLSLRIYKRDYLSMKKWAEQNNWKRLLLVKYQGKWYFINDFKWLDEKVLNNKGNLDKQLALGVAKKALPINILPKFIESD